MFLHVYVQFLLIKLGTMQYIYMYVFRRFGIYSGKHKLLLEELDYSQTLWAQFIEILNFILTKFYRRDSS